MGSYTKLPKKVKPQIVIPTKADVEKMLLSSAGDKDLYTAVLLSSCMGLRRSEICALEKKDVTEQTLSITKAMVLNDGKAWVVKQPKSYVGTRKIKMPKRVKEYIDGMPDGRLLSSDPNEITQRFETMLKRNDIHHCRFHDLRHYYASVLQSLNVPDKYAMENMGHETDHMLKTVYQHTMSEKRKEVDAEIDGYFG